MHKNKGMIWTVLCAVILIFSSLLSVVNVAAHDTHHSEEYVDIIVRYHDTVPPEDDLNPDFKNVMTLELLPIQSMSVPASSIKDISLQPNVKRVTYDQEIETSETTREVPANDWNQDMIGTFDAWEEGFFGDAVDVAVLDTGFYDHPEMTYAGGFSIFDEEHELGPDDWTNDHDGHGTHVAGIIAANQGSRGQGIAPNVNLYGVKIYHESRGNRTNLTNLMAGLQLAILQDVDIINISSGYPEHNQEMKELIDLAVQNNILVVAASGNATDENPDIDYPAAYPEVISVANVDNNYMHVYDSVISELNELAAPGQSIIGLGTPVDNADYVTMSGTSQSTPHVVGIAALLMQKYPNESAAQIRARMQQKALDLGDEGFDIFYGHGLVQYSQPVLPIEDEDEGEDEEDTETTPEEEEETESPEEEEPESDDALDENEETEQPDDPSNDETEEAEEDVSEKEPADEEDDSVEEDADEDPSEDVEDESETDDSDESATRSTVWIRPSATNNVATISQEDLESVGDNGVLAVSFDSTLSHIDRLQLSATDIQEIKERNITLLIARMDMEWVVPSNNLDANDALLIFESADVTLPYVTDAKSEPLAFSIEQNGERQTVFASPMTYRFFTNEAEANQDYLYQWDLENDEWVLLGNNYTNGGVVGTSNTTATLAVFNPDDLSAAITDSTSPSDEEDDDMVEETVESTTVEEEEATVERAEAEEDALDLPVALSGAVVILAAVGGGFYFFGGKSKD